MVKTSIHDFFMFLFFLRRAWIIHSYKTLQHSVKIKRERKIIVHVDFMMIWTNGV